MKRFLNAKTLLFALLVTVIAGLILFTRLAQRPEDVPPGTDPTFGELLAPIPRTPSQYQPPRNTTANLPEETVLPQTAGVYRQSVVRNMQDHARSLATALGLKGQLQAIDRFLTLADGEKYMRLETDTGKLTYSQPLPEYLQSKNPQGLESLAILLAQSAGQNEKLWDSPQTQTEFFVMENIHEFHSSTPDAATNATVHVFPAVEGKRVISGKQPPFDRFGPIAVDFDFARSTVILVSQSIGVDFSQSGTYPLRTKETALQELMGGQAFISSIAPEGQPASLIETSGQIPTSANFTDIEIVYYYDPIPDALLQPMYLFTGKARLSDGRNATITALLPAIDPQFLKSP